MFSCEFCEISRNTSFHRTPPVAGSVLETVWIIAGAPFIFFMVIQASKKKVYMISAQVIFSQVENWILILFVLNLKRQRRDHTKNSLCKHSVLKDLRYYIWKKIMCGVLKEGGGEDIEETSNVPLTFNCLESKIQTLEKGVLTWSK